MREIALDTETTGLDPLTGDRIVEIGCVEMINHVATNRSFHRYLNPERPMPAEALAVHGLTDEFLADKPVFAEVAQDFLEFIGDARLVIHNAEFDMRFLNAELSRLGFQALPMSRSFDTVALCRKRYPGAQANLDALCKRFGIDNSDRTLHGALLDAQLLAEVYLELMGGRQPGLILAKARDGARSAEAGPREVRQPRPHAAAAEELAAHAEFLKKLKDPLWQAG
ncbi:MAG TPA: DNA polymerase III subunit epsilon [Alphaproteobacteria bacterium]|nr:DNA polymerase III subunit epsilon [Alphaproteobacteria bacterium]